MGKTYSFQENETRVGPNQLQVPPLNALYTKTNKQTSYLTMEPLLTSWYTNSLINMYMFSEHKEKEQVRIHNILQNAYAIG